MLYSFFSIDIMQVVCLFKFGITFVASCTPYGVGMYVRGEQLDNYDYYGVLLQDWFNCSRYSINT